MRDKDKKTNKHFNDNWEGGESDLEHVPIQAKPLEVKVRDSFERAMKIFRSLVQKERVLSTYKEKQRYEKKSDKRRRKRNEHKRKLMELETKNDFNPKRKKIKEIKNNDGNI